MGIKNKIALITGGGRGIGAATARLFAEAGARVVIASRTESELKSVAHGLKDSGLSCEYRITDIASEAAVLELFETTKRSLGPFDIVVNNAGIVHSSPFESVSLSHFEELMAINLRGTFLNCREAFRQMKGRGGSIVNVSSLAGLQGTEKFSNLSTYTASKFAVIGLTEALAVEGRSDRIRVNAVAPGAVNTAMLAKAAPHLKTKTEPIDIAKILLFLSDESQSGALTGSTVPIFSNN